MTAEGHEERFPPTRLSAGVGSGRIGARLRRAKIRLKMQSLGPPLDTRAKMSIGVRHFCRSHLF